MGARAMYRYDSGTGDERDKISMFERIKLLRHDCYEINETHGTLLLSRGANEPINELANQWMFRNKLYNQV